MGVQEILDDFDVTEVTIRIKPETLDYQVSLGMIKLGLLEAVLKDILRMIEDGTFIQGEDLNVYNSPEDHD